MKLSLTAALTEVFLDGEERPEDCSIYAILFRDGREIERRWLPDGTIVEDPGDQLLRDRSESYPTNPLFMFLPSGLRVPHPDNGGEIVRMSCGDLAVVFNTRRDSQHRRDQEVRP